MTLSQDLAKVEAEIARVCDGYAIQFRQPKDEPNHGIVLVRRPEDFQPYVTWRWATADTSGHDVQSPTGAHLFSGHYLETYEEAVMDFEAREPR